MTLLPQLPSSQVLWAADKDIRVPHSHVGNIRPPPKECLKWHNVTCAGCHGPIDGVDGGSKGVSPQEVRCACILYQHASFVKDPVIQPLSNSILLWGVWYGEFYGNPILSTV